MDDAIALLYAAMFFAASLTFIVIAIRCRRSSESLLAFWYAVIFEFAGFAALTVHRMLSR